MTQSIGPAHDRRVSDVAAVIWDAGGTLFDTYPAVVSAARTVLSETGLSLPADRLMALFRRSTQHALTTIAEELAVSLEGLTARFGEVYTAVDARHQPPFPYVVEVCRWVRSTGGRNYIVTHRGRASLISLLAAHDMTSLFSDCITEEDPYPRKPDPTSLLALMSRHDLVPRRCLVVGDRRLDIIAGNRAGALTCLYGDEDGVAQLADVHILGYDELLRWLQVRNRQNE